jgi:catechol 2,3-dioxygenase-like lactoylglutathione lyase family enzyme
MLLNHVGLTNKSEEDAVRFYRDFLGLELTRRSVVPAGLSEQLFSVTDDLGMIVFEREGIKIEVFISPVYTLPVPDINHIGFLLDNFQEIVERAANAGVKLIIGKTKDKTVYFVRDFSGNLIEIKQK